MYSKLIKFIVLFIHFFIVFASLIGFIFFSLCLFIFSTSNDYSGFFSAFFLWIFCVISLLHSFKSRSDLSLLWTPVPEEVRHKILTDIKKGIIRR